MLLLAWRALVLGFLIAALAHVAAAITVMLFEDHHTMAATLVRSILISIISAPLIFYALWLQGSRERDRDTY